MKFLHTSDIHLGAKFEYLGEKAGEQREQLRKTFSKIVDYAIEQKVDLFLIAGDLFDSNHPSRKNIDFIKSEFLRLNNSKIRVCLIAGNHDFELGNKNNLGKEFSNLEKEGIFLFTDKDGSKVYFEDIDTEVYAKANFKNKSSKSPMVPTDKQRRAEKIIMAHGGVVGQAKNPQWPIKPKEIEDSGANYVALGDWHSMREESRGEVKAFYSGSPEMLNINQSGAGYIIVGTLEYGLIKIKPIKIGATKSKSIDINLEDFESVDKIKEEIVNYSDKKLVLVVNFVGINKNKLIFNTDELEEELNENFWRVRIQDKTRLPVEEFTDADYPSVLISGQFVKIMKEKIQSAKNKEDKKLYEEALQMGIMAFNDPDVIT